MFLMGKFKNHPLMQQFNQMMAGKTYEQQKQTLLNFAQSRGFDTGMVEQLLKNSHQQW